MTDDQREMHEMLLSLAQRVESGDVTGMAIGTINRARMVQVFSMGSCSREPVLTLGIVRVLSRYVEDDMLSPQPPPDGSPPKTRKS